MSEDSIDIFLKKNRQLLIHDFYQYNKEHPNMEVDSDDYKIAQYLLKDIEKYDKFCEYYFWKSYNEDTDEYVNCMDIGSKNGYPAGSLSNFAPHPFTMDGVKCASMEGFLQSLKFESQEMQEHVCTLVGLAAKKKGAPKKWQRNQTLYWRGKEYKRDSEDYQLLLNKAYNRLFENTGFKNALNATNGAVLTHSIGKSKKSETVLTAKEFCSRLTHLRDIGKLEEKKKVQEELF